MKYPPIIEDIALLIGAVALVYAINTLLNLIGA